MHPEAGDIGPYIMATMSNLEADRGLLERHHHFSGLLQNSPFKSPRTIPF